MVRTSPSFSALPDGMLSVHISHAVTFVRHLSALSADMVDSTAAAPDMSIFITWWNGSLGLSEMPPESYMMPLPTSARCPDGFFGDQVSLTIRGGSVEPRFTPSRPPQPICSS